MTGEQASNNADASDVQSSQQSSHSDGNALAHEIADAVNKFADSTSQIAQELKKANEKSKNPLVWFSLSISLLSLLSTIVLGTVVNIYLYGKQAQTNLNYRLAHLALDVLPSSNCHSKSTLGCLAELQVTNKGPALAIGITVDVFLQKIASPWTASIKDINNFTINTLPSTRHIPWHPFYDYDPSALDGVTDNAFELKIDSLPPPSNTSSVQVDLGLKPGVAMVAKTTTINTTLYVVSQNFQNYNFGFGFPTNQVIQKYFDQFFSIADFAVNVTCQNCVNDPDPLAIKTSSLEKAALVLSLSPLNLLNSIWSGPIMVTYEQPKRSNLPALGNSLYLWTELDNPTAPLDSITQAYLGIVTTCAPTGQPGGSQETCTPNSTSGGGGGI